MNGEIKTALNLCVNGSMRRQKTGNQKGQKLVNTIEVEDIEITFEIEKSKWSACFLLL